MEENYLVIDRKYIEERTTLSEEEQNKIDEQFIQAGIMTKRNTNSICLDINRLISIICCEDDLVLEDLTQIFKKTKKKAAKS